jgi:hypothetical protein
MEEEGHKSALISGSLSTSGDVFTSHLPNIVSLGSSVVAPLTMPSKPATTSDVHCVESSGKLSTSFADGLDLKHEGDENSSWSNDVSDDDDSDVDISLVDSEDEKSNENDSNDDSTSSITGHHDEINEVILSQGVEKASKVPASKISERDCSSHTDDSSDSFVEDHVAEINEQTSDSKESDKMETPTVNIIDSELIPAKTSTIKIQRGLQRKPTGDSDTLGEILHGLKSRRSDEEHLVNENGRQGRRLSSYNPSDAGPKNLTVDAHHKEPMRTRRGIQRIPTGDSDTLADMIQNGSKCISDIAPAVMEVTGRGGRRKPKNDAQIEVIGIDEVVKTKEPLKTRRGVQRKATGDSDTLIALVQGLDSVARPSNGTAKVLRGGRKKERPSDDINDPVDPSSESKKPLRTRRGLRRQATGDSDTLADLIARKGNTTAEGIE